MLSQTKYKINYINMTQYEKLLKRFLENPENIDLKWLIKILEKNGFKKKQAKWSHTIYKSYEWKTITLPIHNNNIKKEYKKLAKKILFNN